MTEPLGRMVKMGRRVLQAPPGRMVRTVMREHLGKMDKMGKMGKMGKMVLLVATGHKGLKGLRGPQAQMPQ